MDMKYLGTNLKHLRLKFGLNQAEMSIKIGISQSSYTYIEKGKRGLSIANIIKVCEAFDTTFEYLLTDPDAHYDKLANLTSKEKINELTYSQLACLTEENCKVIYELAIILGN